MSPAPTYLAQNHFGIYYFRLAVPVKLRKIVGRREFRQSLRTKNRKEAPCSTPVFDSHRHIFV